MKKLFIVLAVASLGFVACNNDSSADDAAKKAADSTRIADSIAAAQRQADSIANLAPKMDTLPKVDSPAKTPAKK